MLCRKLPPPDEQRYRAVFTRAMLATGVDPSERKIELLQHDDQRYHVMVWGGDALDCHAYSSPVFKFRDSDLSSASLSSLSNREYAQVIVEQAPVPVPGDEQASRRVAIAVASLLDTDTIALFHYWSRRLVAVTPETPVLLRSAHPDDAFAHGVSIPAFEQ